MEGKCWCMKRKLRCRVACIFLSMLILCSVSGGVLYVIAQSAPSPVAFADVDASFWGKPAIDKWSGMGVVMGDGENFYPNTQITRAELMAILGRIFGYSAAVDNPFADISQSDWYYNTLIAAYAKGFMKGDYNAEGKLAIRANDPVSRAEAAVLFQRVFAVTVASGSATQFKDAYLPDWAAPAIYGMETAGYIRGNDGLFDPSGSLTRAQMVQMLDNIVKLYINQAGEYNGDVGGSVVINAANVKIKDMKITGSLYLAEGIGSGNVSLENITVTSSTFVRGGGAVTVTQCSLGNRVIEKQDAVLSDAPTASTPAPTSTPSGSSSGSDSGNGSGSNNPSPTKIPIATQNPDEPKGADTVEL